MVTMVAVTLLVLRAIDKASGQHRQKSTGNTDPCDSAADAEEIESVMAALAISLVQDIDASPTTSGSNGGHNASYYDYEHPSSNLRNQRLSRPSHDYYHMA